MSRDLFRHDLPVVITSRPGVPPPNAVATSLQAVLTLSPTATLSFTLSDLKDRLFIASFDLSAAEYPAVRDAQSLRVDFTSFPHRVADLLRRPASDPSFSAHLVFPDDILDEETGERPSSASASQPLAQSVTFSILQTNNFKLLRHLDLTLSLAPASLVRRALADATKSADAARADAEDRAAEASARAEAAEAQLDELRPDAAATPSLRNRITEVEARLADATAELDMLRPLSAEVEVLREETNRLRNASSASSAECSAAQAQAAAFEEELREARTRLHEAAAELRKTNRAASHLEEGATMARRRARVAEAVVERQEAAVEREEKRAAAAERDLRRARDREEMLVVERDGTLARLEAARERIEEADVLQASNQQVIAYLNRQLNSRAIARQQGPSTGTGRRPRSGAFFNSDEGDLADRSSAGTDQSGGSSLGGVGVATTGSMGQYLFPDDLGGASAAPRTSVAAPSAFPLSSRPGQGGSSDAGPAVS